MTDTWRPTDLIRPRPGDLIEALRRIDAGRYAITLPFVWRPGMRSRWIYAWWRYAAA